MRTRQMLPLLFLILLLAACVPPVAPTPASAPHLPPCSQTLVVMTHDSFAATEDVVRQFEQENNATVDFLKAGDAGEALNKACLSKDNPLADVFYGVDNAFSVVQSTAASSNLPLALAGQYSNRLATRSGRTAAAVDSGYVTLNYDKGWFEQKGLPVPQTLEDLTKPNIRAAGSREPGHLVARPGLSVDHDRRLW